MGILTWLKGKKAPDNIYSGGPGDTAEHAIIISAPNSMVGITAEYVYVEKECGQKDVDWTLELQMNIAREGRNYDCMTVAFTDGSDRTFWFDITSFYGKHF